MQKASTIKIFLLAVFAASTLLLSACDHANNRNETEPLQSEGSEESFSSETIFFDLPTDIDINTLKEKYPEFFGLDSSEGFDVCVWQMAADSYTFALFEKGEGPKNLTDVLDLRGVNALYMRMILSEYGITKDMVNIVPVRHPLSSYIGQYYLSGDNMPDQHKEAYINNIKLLLLDEYYSRIDALYSTYIYDIDNDGVSEICSIGLGRTSGLWSFTISARDAAGLETEHESVAVFNQLKELRFLPTPEGLSIAGVDLNGEYYTFDVGFADGKIILYEDGEKLK